MRIRTEDVCCRHAADVQTTTEQTEANARRVLIIVIQRALNSGGLAFALEAERMEIVLAARPERRDLHALSTFERTELNAIALVQFKDGRPSALQNIALDSGFE